MTDPRDNYRSDGCGGIHSHDVSAAIDNGDLVVGSDGFLYGENGSCFDTDGGIIEEGDDDW